MANREHLAKLKEGVEAWNDWRKANPEIIPDLSEANLIRADLRGAELGGAKLGGTDLGRAKLGGADLNGAYLPFTDIRMWESFYADEGIDLAEEIRRILHPRFQ